MPSLKLTKEDVDKQLTDLRRDLISSLDSRLADIKRDVDLVADVKSGALPLSMDGVIATVQDITLQEQDWRRIDAIEFGFSGRGNYRTGIQSIELPAGRYRVFISVHKVPE